MAACTWTVPDKSGLNVSAMGVAAGATANDAPTASEGIDLSYVRGLAVTVGADSGQTLSAAGTLEAWFKSPQAGWARMKELDITVSSLCTTGTVRFATALGPSAGLGVPIIFAGGRLCWVPNGVTVSSGGVTIYLDGWRQP